MGTETDRLAWTESNGSEVDLFARRKYGAEIGVVIEPVTVFAGPSAKSVGLLNNLAVGRTFLLTGSEFFLKLGQNGSATVHQRGSKTEETDKKENSNKGARDYFDPAHIGRRRGSFRVKKIERKASGLSNAEGETEDGERGLSEILLGSI